MTALPARTLYASSTRIAGYGFGELPYETLVGLHGARILGRAVTFGRYASPMARWPVANLRWRPVQLLSLVSASHYAGARRKLIDSVTARLLAGGKYDLFHGWSGECVTTLRNARSLGVPAVVQVPTWHSGHVRPAQPRTSSPRFYEKWLKRFLIRSEQTLEEYDLANLLLVPSQRARETFLDAGLSAEKLFVSGGGVDVEQFTPLKQPPIFRVLYVGPLLLRKGVHLLLEAWRELKLPDAELALVGIVSDEIRPYLNAYGGDNVKIHGEIEVTAQLYQQASVHVFPSSIEGVATSTYEAAACGLPQITTRESGDVVVHGLNGLIVPCEDRKALMAAMDALHRDSGMRTRMSEAARKRAVENLTWDKFRERILEAYRLAFAQQ